MFTNNGVFIMHPKYHPEWGLLNLRKENWSNYQ